MFRLSKKDALAYYESEGLGRLGFLKHGFLTRAGGISPAPFATLNFSVREGDLQQNVDSNFRAIEQVFGIRKFFLMSQVHGDRILILSDGCERDREIQPQADAVMTAERGIAIGIKSADCVPILLADPVNKVVAAVHAGWRGTALRIVSKTIERLESDFSSRRENIIAAIGPAIGSCCYEVDLPVLESMEREDRQLAFKKAGPDRWMLDLPCLNGKQLIRAGLPEQNISIAGLCTSCRTDLFFSHRREGKTGRHLNFILLRY